MKTADNSKMGQDLFTCLPSEIILNILLRLPAQTIMSCKCVCKPWLELLATPEFVKSHISQSVPGIVIFKPKLHPKPFKFVEFEEGHRWNIAFNFDLPFHEPMHSSVNGLLLCVQGYHPNDIFVCNPITRDYIKIPSPRQPFYKLSFHEEIYGFGLSRMSGQYKVVRVFIERPRQTPPGFQLDQSECHVYTVGTGSWRGIASNGLLRYVVNRAGEFLNGNLHWLAHELPPKGSFKRISCLDLETELFSTFSTPLVDSPDWNLSVLGDCLCLCVFDNVWDDWMSGYEIDIWLMKEYGDEKSWAKEFVFRKIYPNDYVGFICPIKVFKDGDILMELGCGKLLYYSSKTNTIQEADDVLGLESNSFRSITIFTPSFLSLKTFDMENVSSF